MLGHPKQKSHLLPLSRFFQENRTEVFEIECDGNTFEMFESMRVYIERNGRSYNYLPSVGVLNVKREEELVKEEKQNKVNKYVSWTDPDTTETLKEKTTKLIQNVKL